MSNFMESFSARAKPQNGLRAVLQDLHESLEMFVPADYMYFADLVKEFVFEAPSPPPKRVTETCEALFSNADLLQSFRNVRVKFTRFALKSMMPESCAAGINVMCGDNDSDLPQIIELERQAWPFEGRWCEMWATACEFTGHCNQREDGQHILAGVVSTSCGTYEASHQSGSQVCQTPYGGSCPSGCQPNVQRGLWGHATQAQETS